MFLDFEREVDGGRPSDHDRRASRPLDDCTGGRAVEPDHCLRGIVTIAVESRCQQLGTGFDIGGRRDPLGFDVIHILFSSSPTFGCPARSTRRVRSGRNGSRSLQLHRLRLRRAQSEADLVLTGIAVEERRERCRERGGQRDALSARVGSTERSGRRPGRMDVRPSWSRDAGPSMVPWSSRPARPRKANEMEAPTPTAPIGVAAGSTRRPRSRCRTASAFLSHCLSPLGRRSAPASSIVLTILSFRTVRPDLSRQQDEPQDHISRKQHQERYHPDPDQQWRQRPGRQIRTSWATPSRAMISPKRTSPESGPAKARGPRDGGVEDRRNEPGSCRPVQRVDDGASGREGHADPRRGGHGGVEPVPPVRGVAGGLLHRR